MLRAFGIASLMVLCLTAATAGSAQTQTDAPKAPPESASVSSTPLVSDPDFALGEGDVVDILVVGSNDFNTRARVSTDGAVLLPLLGPVQAGGGTPSALADRIAAALKKGGYFANPVVRVELVGIRSRYITVLGQVGSPGLMPLDRAYRLSEVMAKVGHTTGGGNTVVVTSKTGESKSYSIEKLATGGPADDPVVMPGDKIFVSTGENEVAYLSGEVHAPGAFPVGKGLTVRIAVARAGGVTENGNENKIKIIRNGQKLPKPTLETELQPGDVVTIGGRMF